MRRALPRNRLLVPMISIERPILLDVLSVKALFVDVLSVKVLLMHVFLPVGLKGEQFGCEKQIRALSANKVASGSLKTIGQLICSTDPIT